MNLWILLKHPAKAVEIKEKAKRNFFEVPLRKNSLSPIQMLKRNQQQTFFYFGPTIEGTGSIIISCIISLIVAQSLAQTSPDIDPTLEFPITNTLKYISGILMVGLGTSAWLDMRYGLQNLVRIDLAGLAALYFLIFFEFLFPQPTFELINSATSVEAGVKLSLWGLGALAIGRHLVNFKTRSSMASQITEIQTNHIIGFFWFSSFIAYYYMLVAVNFNIFDMIDKMMGARFSQPWGRGAYGTLSTLIHELGMMSYVLPPIGGYLITLKRLPALQRILIGAIVALTIFKGFASGTRNQFAAYFLLFLAGYLLLQPKLQLKRILIVGGISGVLFIVASKHMLHFRQIGLKNYFFYDETTETFSDALKFNTEESYQVDYNLSAISSLATKMPEIYPHIGFEIYWWSLIKPIPRGLWSGKPKGLSTTIEKVVGLDYLTISATFVGESYMGYGLAGVIGTGLLFGVFCGFANKFRQQTHSVFGLLIYASAFFPMILSMRSMIWFTTALLPTCALVTFALYMRSRKKPFR